jgi:hypothetical protein
MVNMKYQTVVTTILSLICVQFCLLPVVYAIDSPADTNQALLFLSDVVGLDMTKYEATLETCSASDFSDVSIIGDIGYVRTSGKYVLQYWDTKEEQYSLLHCIFNFAGSTLISCSLSTDSGKALYSKPLPPNLVDAARVFVARYEQFTNDLQLSEMESILANIDGAKNTTKTVNELQLSVSVTSYATSFNWKSFNNGIEYPGMGVTFIKGEFSSFGDRRSIYTIASTKVNISREKAIELALNKSEGFSYKYNDTTVSNFTIVKDQILADLLTKSKDSPTELYPFWAVYLPLSEVYPGHVSVIRVELWADTGDVISCQTLSYGGPVPDDSSNNSSPEPSSVPTSSSSSSNPTQNSPLSQLYVVYVAVALMAVAIPTLLVAVRRKHRKVE